MRTCLTVGEAKKAPFTSTQSSCRRPVEAPGSIRISACRTVRRRCRLEGGSGTCTEALIRTSGTIPAMETARKGYCSSFSMSITSLSRCATCV